MLRVLGIGNFNYLGDRTALPIIINDEYRYCISQDMTVLDLSNYDNGEIIQLPITKLGKVELEVKTADNEHKSYYFEIVKLYAWARICYYGIKDKNGNDYADNFWDFWRKYNVYEYEDQILIFDKFYKWPDD